MAPENIGNVYASHKSKNKYTKIKINLQYVRTYAYAQMKEHCLLFQCLRQDYVYEFWSSFSGMADTQPAWDTLATSNTHSFRLLAENS